MPKIPIYSRTQSLSTQAPAVETNAASYGQVAGAKAQMGNAIAQGGAQIANTADNLYAKFQEAKNYHEELEGDLALIGHVNTISEKAAQDPDVEKNLQNYQNELTQGLSESAKSITDPELRNQFMLKGQMKLESVNASLRDLGRKSIITKGQANVQSWIDNVMAHYAETGSEKALNEIKKVITHSKERGFYNDKQAYDLEVKSIQDAKMQRFQTVASNNPEDAKKMLDSNFFSGDIKAADTAASFLEHVKNLEKKRIAEVQDVRNDGVINQMLQGTLSFKDLNRELEIPEDQGGIPRKILLNYKTGLERNIGQDLKSITSQKTVDNRPTKQSTDAKQYLTMIDAFIDDDTDKWMAREFLAKSYADGIVSPSEMKVLDPLKKNLDDIKFNRSNGPITRAIKHIKGKFNQYNASDSEIALSIKTLLNTIGSGVSPEEAAANITKEYLKGKIPGMESLPTGGKLHIDAFGNQAMIYPDGTIEELGNKNKVKKP